MINPIMVKQYRMHGILHFLFIPLPLFQKPGQLRHAIPVMPQYTFRIFTNLGVPVAEGSGEIDQEQLSRLSSASQEGESNLYALNIVWNGKTASHAPAAAGAYIIRAIFHFPKDERTGAKPAEELKTRLFGYAR